jgi:hypothetical protein
MRCGPETWAGSIVAFGSLTIKSKIGVATAYTCTDSSSRLDRYSALKVLAVEATSAKGLDEEGIHRKILPGSASPWRCPPSQLLRHIPLHEPVGRASLPRHRNPRPRPKLLPECSALFPVSIPIIKRIVRQILLGLDFLHVECGIVHTGAMVQLFLRFQIRCPSFPSRS